MNGLEHSTRRKSATDLGWGGLGSALAKQDKKHQPFHTEATSGWLRAVIVSWMEG